MFYMHENAKFRVVLEISSRTYRHAHRQTYSSQYFATAPVSEVIICKSSLLGNTVQLELLWKRRLVKQQVSVATDKPHNGLHHGKRAANK